MSFSLRLQEPEIHFPPVFHISQKKEFLTRPQSRAAAGADAPERSGGGCRPRGGIRGAPGSAIGRVPAGGSCSCHARHQMGNLAPSETLPRPAGSVESCPGCCHHGRGDVPPQPQPPGDKGRKHGHGGGDVQRKWGWKPWLSTPKPHLEHLWLPQSPAPGGGDSTGLHTPHQEPQQYPVPLNVPVPAAPLKPSAAAASRVPRPHRAKDGHSSSHLASTCPRTQDKTSLKRCVNYRWRSHVDWLWGTGLGQVSGTRDRCDPPGDQDSP